MAGGEGTRLRPLTSNQPKPMVPIVGKPCMEHILELLKRARLRRRDRHASRSCRRRSAATSATARRSASTSRTRSRSRRSARPARCGSRADQLDETFLVISGDALCDVDLDELVEFHREKGAAGHDRPQVGRQPARVRDRRHRRGRPHRALPREAVVGPGLLGHDQHRHLRARAGGAAAHPDRPAVRLLEGALPAAARDGPAALRLRHGRLLAGHRQPRPVPPGELRRARRERRARTSPASGCAATSGSARASSSTTSTQIEGPAFIGNYCRDRARARPSAPYSVLGANVTLRERARIDALGHRRVDAHRPQRARRGRDRRPLLRHPRARAHPRGRRDRRRGHDRRRERRSCPACGSTRTRRSSPARRSTRA